MICIDGDLEVGNAPQGERQSAGYFLGAGFRNSDRGRYFVVGPTAEALSHSMALKLFPLNTGHLDPLSKAASTGLYRLPTHSTHAKPRSYVVSFPASQTNPDAGTPSGFAISSPFAAA